MADRLLHMVADKVASMVADMAADKKKFLGWDVVAHDGQQGGRHGGRNGGQQKKYIFILFLADMELDMVADKEVEAFYYW